MTYPTIAEALYSTSMTLTEVQVAFLARSRAKDTHTEVLSGVEYTTYVFSDKSSLSVANNGYVGVGGIA